MSNGPIPLFNPPEQPIDMNLRYVLYSSAKGVYLGKKQWAKEPGDKPDDAPTYKRGEETDLELHNSPLDGKFVLVFPDRPNNRASKNAVLQAHLPDW